MTSTIVAVVMSLADAGTSSRVVDSITTTTNAVDDSTTTEADLCKISSEAQMVVVVRCQE